jgi:hypothetical protein
VTNPIITVFDTEFNRKKLKERDRLGDIGLDGRMIINWILKKYGVWIWTELIYLWTEFSGGVM